jgi:hypothetical protein
MTYGNVILDKPDTICSSFNTFFNSNFSQPANSYSDIDTELDLCADVIHSIEVKTES